MSKTAEEILEAYRQAYKKANGKTVDIYKKGGWVYVNESPHRLSLVIEMLQTLEARVK